MNKLKKVGLTALAGTLVASVAHAGALDVTGSASLSMKSTSGAVNNNGFSMNDEATLSGGGEMDNGWNVTISLQLDNDENSSGNGAFDNRSLTIDMGDSGTLVFNGHGGSMPVNTIDDKLPTANEEAHGSVNGSGNWGVEGLGKGAGDDGWWKYSNSNIVDSLAIDIGYVPSSANEVEGSVEVGLTYTGVDGLTVGAAFGDNKAATKEIENTNVYATYATGAFTVGVQSNTSDHDTATSSVDMSGFGVSYAVNDELSISYGQNTVEYNTSSKVDQEATGINFSYVMGSMTLSGGHSKVEAAGGVTGNDPDGYEVNLSFAF